MSRKERGSSGAASCGGAKTCESMWTNAAPPRKRSKRTFFVKIETTREMTFALSDVIAQVAVSF